LPYFGNIYVFLTEISYIMPPGKQWGTTVSVESNLILKNMGHPNQGLE
jgi:hypothetical protein